MSLRTWEQEFYPVPASAHVTDEEAVAQGILKWTGLRRENLERHGVVANHSSGYVEEDLAWFAISSDTCSLCRKHLRNRNVYGRCIGCPLARNSQPCDTIGFAYWLWRQTGDPEPMIGALTLCLPQPQISGSLPPS